MKRFTKILWVSSVLSAGFDALYAGRNLRVFRMSALPSYSGCKSNPSEQPAGKKTQEVLDGVGRMLSSKCW
jgi:hypothetical protein